MAGRAGRAGSQALGLSGILGSALGSRMKRKGRIKTTCQKPAVYHGCLLDAHYPKRLADLWEMHCSRSHCVTGKPRMNHTASKWHCVPGARNPCSSPGGPGAGRCHGDHKYMGCGGKPATLCWVSECLKYFDNDFYYQFYYIFYLLMLLLLECY